MKNKGLLAVLAVFFGLMIFISVSCKKATPTSVPTATATINQTPTPATGDDAYEDDDTAAAANLISTNGYPQYHNFYTAELYDCVSFTAQADTRYEIKVVVSYTASMPRLYTYLYDYSLSLVSQSYYNTANQGLNYYYYIFNCATTGVRYVMVTNNDNYSGANTGYLVSVKQLPAITAVALNTSLNNTSLTYLDSGDAYWFGQSNIKHDTSGAAQSGAIMHSQSSSFSATVNAGAQVNFYWKVSSEFTYDYLAFYDDGLEVTRITGEADWADITYNVANDAVPHVLRWTYAKDSSLSCGYDAGWVDQLTVTY